MEWSLETRFTDTSTPGAEPVEGVLPYINEVVDGDKVCDSTESGAVTVVDVQRSNHVLLKKKEINNKYFEQV
jgi:hypothetical protein